MKGKTVQKRAARRAAADPAEQINREHQLTLDAADNAIAHAVRCGELLIQQKKLCGHGNFQNWVREHCTFSHDSANNYMRAARQKTSALVFSSLRQLIAHEKVKTRTEFVSFRYRDAAAKYKLREGVTPEMFSAARETADMLVQLAKVVAHLDGREVIRSLTEDDCNTIRPHLQRARWFIAEATAEDRSLYGRLVQNFATNDAVVEQFAAHAEQQATANA